jgi:hypothetical protein
MRSVISGCSSKYFVRTASIVAVLLIQQSECKTHAERQRNCSSYFFNRPLASLDDEYEGFVDKIVLILNRVYTAGPSLSLIREDLDEVEGRMDSEFARRLREHQERFTEKLQKFNDLRSEVKSGDDPRRTALLIVEMLMASIELFDAKLEPARRLRSEIMGKLSGTDTTQSPGTGGVFRRAGGHWEVRFEAKSDLLPDSVGIFYLNILLNNTSKTYGVVR